MNLPKLTGREFRPFDLYGWMMALLGCVVMFLLIRDHTMSWPTKIIFMGTNVLLFLDYVWRVAYGRVYKFVFYDTIIHVMYEIDVNNERFYICAEDEDELKLYMGIHYPFITEEYKIINQSEVESFIKRELYQ